MIFLGITSLIMNFLSNQEKDALLSEGAVPIQPSDPDIVIRDNYEI